MRNSVLFSVCICIRCRIDPNVESKHRHPALHPLRYHDELFCSTAPKVIIVTRYMTSSGTLSNHLSNCKLFLCLTYTRNEQTIFCSRCCAVEYITSISIKQVYSVYTQNQTWLSSPASPLKDD